MDEEEYGGWLGGKKVYFMVLPREFKLSYSGFYVTCSYARPTLSVRQEEI